MGSAGWDCGPIPFRPPEDKDGRRGVSIIHSEEAQWLSRKTTVVTYCQICVSVLNVTTSIFTACMHLKSLQTLRGKTQLDPFTTC